MKEDNIFYLFTDGASRKNPGPGGWGAILLSQDHVLEMGEGVDYATNNQMELTAVIKGLEEAYRKIAPVIVYTDSQYLINGITKWISSWKANDWKTKAGTAVSNKDLWEKLHTIVSLIKKKSFIKFTHVPAHVGLLLNERADKIATSFSQGSMPFLYNGTFEDYEYKSGLDNLDETIAKLKAVKVKSKKGSKKAAYSYVSLVGEKVETHATWVECEARVRGVPYARFKKSFDKEDELDIIKKWLKK